MLRNSEAAIRDVLYEKVFLEIPQNSQENTVVCNFIKKETLAQVFSCEFCEISKSTFFTEHLLATASGSFLEQWSFRIVLGDYFFPDMFLEVIPWFELDH